MSAASAGVDVLASIRSAGVFRICIDLNVWVSSLISRRAGRSGTAALTIVDAAYRGRCALGPTQVVISWGMLNRLAAVLEREFERTRVRIAPALAEIVASARYGPDGGSPLLVLGGTGVVPLRDEEDASVLEAAVAGRAHVLATLNFADFVGYRTKVVKPGRIALHRTADHEVVIAHPAEVLPWVQTGRIDLG